MAQQLLKQVRKDLQNYTLECDETGDELGRGSYASVVQLQYKGLKCAGKKIYQILYNQKVENLIARFSEECKMISELRHPNIVQFLGVYFEKNGVPVLVMEYMPTTLSQCLENYGLLPQEVCYSIITDAILGLRYLHEQTTPIIHRDLSANNILLTENFTAKISDLGVAKIVDIPYAKVSRMTRVPGTPCYMPPEALVPNPIYNVSIDIFSFGVLIIHTFSGQWPLPTEAAILDPNKNNQLIPVSESDRRNYYIEIMGESHAMVGLIRSCLNNNPAQRPKAVEIWKQTCEEGASHPPTYKNRLDMLLELIEEKYSKTGKGGGGGGGGGGGRGDSKSRKISQVGKKRPTSVEKKEESQPQWKVKDEDSPQPTWKAKQDPPSPELKAKKEDPPPPTWKAKQEDPPPSPQWKAKKEEPPPPTWKAKQEDPPQPSWKAQQEDPPQQSWKAKKEEPPLPSRKAKKEEPPQPSWKAKKEEPPQPSRKAKQEDPPQPSWKAKQEDPPQPSWKAKKEEPPQPSWKAKQEDPPWKAKQEDPPQPSWKEEKIESPVKEIKEKQPLLAKIKFDFNARDAEELTVSRGDTVEVVEMEEDTQADQWWLVRGRGARKGGREREGKKGREEGGRERERREGEGNGGQN